MTNADKFKSLFGLYATELWAMPEKDFLKWLNSEVMNSSESPNGWIPCSERLPEDKQKCLVTVKEPWGSCIDLARFAADLHSVDEYDFHDREESGWYYLEPDLGYIELTDVVAWMPLLEPYREVEE